MCGINGYIAKNKTAASVSSDIERMNAAILHRGPDQDGFFIEEGQVTVGMAMRRLSIIDLSTGTQPIYTPDRQKVIVFNGEVYNFKDLRAGLEKDNISFSTQSDTEVVLRLYEKYGVASFAMLDGMFAFSIYDKTLGKIFIARDFFGEKPLYYTKTADRFIWCSELKSIISVLGKKPPIDAQALNLYLGLTYIPAPFSIYEGIRKLQANHYLEFDCATFDFSICEIRHDIEKIHSTSKADCVKTTHDLVRESVASRSVSDVPIGTFLSGGVDSSIVSLCLAQHSASKIDTFSIGFEKRSFDESDKARTVARLIGSNHHEFIIGEKDLAQHTSRILLNFDEPFADSSALASYVVAGKTSQFVKVALTGDGGDEVFGGYNKYYIGRLHEKYTGWISEKMHKFLSQAVQRTLHTSDDSRGKRFKLNRLLKAVNYDGDFYYNILSLGFTESEVREILKSGWFHSNALDHYKQQSGRQRTLTGFRNIDRMTSLEGDMLVKVDRTSMLASLECRAPFLNKKIWDFTSQIPEHYLINGWDKKHILKEAFKSHFPKGFLDKSKKGFGVPVGDWLRGNLRAELLSYIDKAFIERQDLFDFEAVSAVVNQHISGKVDNTFRVWTYFCFQKWYTQTYEK